MQISSMRCSKCGLTQMASAQCKSCGKTYSEGPVQVEPLTPLPSSVQAADTNDSSSEPLQQGRERLEVSSDVDEMRTMIFHGGGQGLFGILIINAFLTLVTFGIYFFWGKVKIRRYLTSQSEFEGDRFAYHGTGKELIFGFLKAVVVFSVIFIAFEAIPFLPGALVVQIVLNTLMYGALATFVGLAIAGSRRYRLSRTSWRGIRFSMRGKIWDFVKVFLKGLLINTITLGIAYPYFITAQYAFLTSNSYFGNEKFNFDGRWQDLMPNFLIAIVLFLPTLGLSWFWFLAKKHRYFWDHTTIAGARFRSTIHWHHLFFLKAGNLLLSVLTLGLGRPWVMVRNVKFNFMVLTLEGPLNLDAIMQEAQEASPIGEGLDTLLDLDSGLSMA